MKNRKAEQQAWRYTNPEFPTPNSEMSSQDARKELALLVNSKYPIICLETWEEGRATEILALVAAEPELAVVRMGDYCGNGACRRCAHL